MKRLVAIAALALAPGLAAAQEGEVSQETVDRIMAMLAEMQCEMDPGDIEAEGGGYELDDVFCADGQYDIDLDENLEVTSRRKE
ncbi:Peptidase propeptide and YPEB domain-containing protein [Rhodovulum sp. ES.010]|uniref:PepSY domain-containing protein n=1 Tax=Rhodovulum sp. ES.010 TaxID=1882821 RepID=UPI00092CC52F|nr:PepSY domain-containing protein [Rhodovulum sp. ES.010]SIO30493.1 Peptidase propeptide and YPEB domain-containing protein [Rhodovulum sp. ES.010]